MTDESVSDLADLDASVQIIRDGDGNPLFATVPHAGFESLMEQARRGVGIDAAADAIRSEMNRLALIPSEVVHRIASGEHPVRVWRLHRGLKAVELAREAGISPGYLSEIETSKKDGTFRTMALIAKTLEVRLDDLMPVVDEEEIEEHRQEVQLRDIARLISEIESMINGRGGFDSGAVRSASQQLMRDAQAFMKIRPGNFKWLEGVIEKAQKIIDEVNSAERNIVGTVSNTQRNLSGVFSDSMSRTGLFPQGMRKPEGSTSARDLTMPQSGHLAATSSAPQTSSEPQALQAPQAAETSAPEPQYEGDDFEDAPEEDDFEDDFDDEDGDDDDDSDFDKSRKGWFRR